MTAALATIPDMRRIAVTLCYYQGLRNREAAAAMGISVEALESLLARGRCALRLRLLDVVGSLLTRY